MFREPSRVPGYFDIVFPDGSEPDYSGLHPDLAMSFDMRSVQPNNMITLADGTVSHLGAMSVDKAGRVVANWYTDFKRHDLGTTMLNTAILTHVSAAKACRDAFAALFAAQQAQIVTFLVNLVIYAADANH